MPNFIEKVFGLGANHNTQKLSNPARNINRYWTSSTHVYSFITSLQLLVAARFVLLIKGNSKADRKYWFLCYAVILMLSDIKLSWLKRETSVDQSVDQLDIDLTNAINDITNRTIEAFGKLSELEQEVKFLKEELYEPDQDKGNNDEGDQDDPNIEDDFLDNDDEEEDDDEG